MLHTKAIIDKANIEEEVGVINGIIGSTSVVDRMGDVIEQDGWDLAAFKENPVILWGHNVREERPPIGTALKVWVEGKGKKAKLMFNIKFDLQDTFAAEIYRKIKDGFINTVSVGFQPTEFEAIDPDDWWSGLRYLKQSLLELSVVPVPANPEALIGLRSLAQKDKRFAPEELKNLYPAIAKEEMAKILNKDVSELDAMGKEEKEAEQEEAEEEVVEEKEEVATETKAEDTEEEAVSEYTDETDLININAGQLKGIMLEVWKDGYEAGDESDEKGMQKPSDDLKLKKMKVGECKALMEDCYGTMRPTEDKAVEGTPIKILNESVTKIMNMAVEKTGRVISAKNEEKIRQAMGLLEDVLSALDKQEEETVDDGTTTGGTENNYAKILPYRKLGICPESEVFSAPEEVKNAGIGTMELMAAYIEKGKENDKSGYLFIHHKGTHDHKAVWRGVASSMALLMGAKGGVNLTNEERRGVYDHLVEHYKEFGKTAPDYALVEGQVLSEINEEIHAIALDREDKHVVRLVKKVLDNDKKQESTTNHIIKALTILNQSLSQISSKEGGE